MNIIESLKLVFRQSMEKKLRVFLTLFGIIIGIFTFTFFIFVSQGLSNAVEEQFNSLGANVLGITSANSASNGPPTGEGLTDKELSKVRQVVRGANYIAPGIFYNINFEYGRDKFTSMGIGYVDENLEDIKSDLGLEVDEGREIIAGDKGVVVLGYKVAHNNKLSSDIKVGSSLKVGDKSFRVIGITKEMGDLMIDSSVLISFNDIKDLSGQSSYSVFRISYPEGTDFDFEKKLIEDRLNPNGKEKVIQITTSDQIIKQFNQILGVLTGIIVFISSIALLVGGINVMNTIHSNVIERTNEISVMKAIGAKNSDILSLFLVESSMLGFFGALIGISMSFGFSKLLSYLIITFTGYNVPIYFDYVFFLIVIVVTSLFTMFFGTYPAIRAANINPADNLRDE